MTGIVAILDANPLIGEMRAGPKRFWTGREEKILREHYPAMGLEACVPLLPGRTAKAIYQRAAQLGLRAPLAARWPVHQRYATSEPIDAAIRRTYQKAPTKGDIQRLAVTLQRPRAWVSHRAAFLGCAIPRFKALPWTPAENAIIAQRATQHLATVRLALKHAGYSRTQTAIAVQLKRLHISRATDDPDLYTARSLADVMGIDSHAVTAWIDKGWLRAKRDRDGRSWTIHQRDVRRFVIDNAGAVDIRKVDKVWFIDLLAQSAPPASETEASRRPSISRAEAA